MLNDRRNVAAKRPLASLSCLPVFQEPDRERREAHKSVSVTLPCVVGQTLFGAWLCPSLRHGTEGSLLGLQILCL